LKRKLYAGGKNGFASAAVSKALPDLKFVVQDIRIIEDIKVDYQDTNIEWMVHDFFALQLVVGADVYLYRFIFTISMMRKQSILSEQRSRP
jgi:hypothetical protein